MNAYERIKETLGALENKGHFRQPYPVDYRANGAIYLEGDKYIDFASNDYLGLTNHPGIRRKSIEYVEKYGTGSAASRLLSGNSVLYEKLERKLADFLQKESGLLFGSGYLANIGVISAFSGTDTLIISDELVHASIIDGIHLCKAQFSKFNHNDMKHLKQLLEAKRSNRENVLIVADSVYSMEGDTAPLDELVEIKDRYGCFLYLDEAHGIGVFGEHGGGLAEEAGLSQKVDIIMTTFGKALGNYGAFVACDGVVRQFLINKARSFIFSTALPPAVIGGVDCAIDVLVNEPVRRDVLKKNYEYFREGLRETNLEIRGNAHIVPVIAGTERHALEIAGYMFENRIFAPAIRPPAVPSNSARLRFSITCDHQKEDLDKVIELLKEYDNNHHNKFGMSHDRLIEESWSGCQRKEA